MCPSPSLLRLWTVTPLGPCPLQPPSWTQPWLALPRSLLSDTGRPDSPEDGRLLAGEWAEMLSTQDKNTRSIHPMAGPGTHPAHGNESLWSHPRAGWSLAVLPGWRRGSRSLDRNTNASWLLESVWDCVSQASPRIGLFSCCKSALLRGEESLPGERSWGRHSEASSNGKSFPIRASGLTQ